MEESKCKIDRVVDRRKLMAPQYPSIDDGLVARWKGTDRYKEQGYRTVTEWFNKRLLYVEYEQAGRDTLSNRIDADYDALTGDDELIKQEMREVLAADGIDTESLLADMVSWGTMRTHLTDCLGEEKETESSDGDWEREAIQIAKSFAAEKTESALSALESSGEISGFDKATVDVEISLRCDECPTVVPLEIALQQGYICEQHSTTRSNKGVAK